MCKKPTKPLGLFPKCVKNYKTSWTIPKCEKKTSGIILNVGAWGKENALVDSRRTAD